MFVQSAERDAATDVRPLAFGFSYSWSPKPVKFSYRHEREQKQVLRVLFLETLSSFNSFSALFNTWEDQAQQQNT